MTEPATPKRPILKPFRVAGSISWTFLDQCVLGLTAFLSNVILARWLTPAEYGGYIFATSVFWITGSAYDGLLSEPMMVFGSGRFRTRLSSYFAVLLLFHCGISILVSLGLVLTAIALLFWESRIPGFSMLGYSIAAPMVLLLWLLRRVFHLKSRPNIAACASLCYLLGTLTILYVLQYSATLSSFTAPLVAAGASALPIGATVVNQRFKVWRAWRSQFMADVASAHWRYGRWALLSAIAAWIPGSIYYVLVPLIVGLSANGALNALWNLVMPAAQLTTAATFLLIPAFGRMRQSRSTASLVWLTLLVMLAGSSLYVVVISLLAGPLLDFVYAGRYTEYAHVAWLMALLVLPIAAITTLGSALRAYERPDRILWAYATSATVTCVFGIAAVAHWGLLGAIAGLLAGYGTTMVTMFWFVLRTTMWAERQRTVNLPPTNGA